MKLLIGKWQSGLGYPTRLLLIRMLALGVLIGIYYLFDWTLLRIGVRGGASVLLDLMGHETTSIDKGNQLYLAIDSGTTFHITPNCTYADLVLVSYTFLWRFGGMIKTNLLRFIILTIVILCINIIRLTLALHLFLQGSSWTLVHDFPDLAIHISVITATVLLALKSDRGVLPGKKSPQESP